MHYRNHRDPFSQVSLSFLDSQSQSSNHRQLPIIKPKLIQPLLQQKKVSALFLRYSPHVILEFLPQLGCFSSEPEECICVGHESIVLYMRESVQNADVVGH